MNRLSGYYHSDKNDVYNRNQDDDVLNNDTFFIRFNCNKT